MAETNASEDRLLLALTTEHFTLQTARVGTIAETNGRILVFLSTLSNSIIALAFVGQSTDFGTPFYAFALSILPAMLVVGFATFMRALQVGVEDAFFGIAIGRIREHYTKLHPDAASLMVLPTGGTMAAVRVEARGETRRSRLQPLYTAAGMVGCVEALVAGAFVALSFNRLIDNAAEWAVALGIVTTVIVVIALFLHSRRYFFGALAQLGVTPPWKVAKEATS